MGHCWTGRANRLCSAPTGRPATRRCTRRSAQKCIEQVRELLSNYGPIDGIWHDIFDERFRHHQPVDGRGLSEDVRRTVREGARLAIPSSRPARWRAIWTRSTPSAANSSKAAVRVHGQRVRRGVSSTVALGPNRSAHGCNTSSTKGTVSGTTRSSPAWPGCCPSTWTSTCC